MEKPTEKKILLDCRDVSLGYEGQALWQGLTFQVRSGDYLCVVGENGSGKSTLLKSTPVSYTHLTLPTTSIV